MIARRISCSAVACLVAGLLASCGGGRTAPDRSTLISAERASAGAESAATSAPGRAYDQGRRPAPEERPGLGTEFGEQVISHVRQSRFVRAGRHPFARVTLHYNDRDGVEAQARHRGAALRDARAYTPHGGISVSLTDPYGRALPGFHGGGRTYVVGGDGQRYNLVLRNDTGGRYEVVASVDGLDVIDGRPAGLQKRGYILNPYSTLVIDGFRTSDASVAAFRFGAVADSYAARKGKGRNVGVIGFAFFAERGSIWTTDELQRRESADPFPSKYARPPSY